MLQLVNKILFKPKVQNKKSQYHTQIRSFMNNIPCFIRKGLFSSDVMEYESVRVTGTSSAQPMLLDMIDAAIDNLETDPDGYFLLVEGKYIYLKATVL